MRFLSDRFPAEGVHLRDAGARNAQLLVALRPLLDGNPKSTALLLRSKVPELAGFIS